MKVTGIIGVFLTLAVLLSHNQVYGKPVTLKNWIIHPEIKVIRNIYKEIKSGIKDGSYRNQLKTSHKWKCYGGCYFSKNSATEYRDIIKYVRSCTRQNSNYQTVEYYFDQSGNIRFRLTFPPSEETIKTKMKNWGNLPTLKIKREYWDEKGIKIWEIEEHKDKKLLYGGEFQKFDRLYLPTGRNCLKY